MSERRCLAPAEVDFGKLRTRDCTRPCSCRAAPRGDWSIRVADLRTDRSGISSSLCAHVSSLRLANLLQAHGESTARSDTFSPTAGEDAEMWLTAGGLRCKQTADEDRWALPLGWISGYYRGVEKFPRKKPK